MTNPPVVFLPKADAHDLLSLVREAKRQLENKRELLETLAAFDRLEALEGEASWLETLEESLEAALGRA